MSVANKTKLIIAIRRYKNIKREQKAKYIDISATDDSNKKVLLRVIDPLGNEFVDLNDVKEMTEQIRLDAYDSAILISKNFTERATDELSKQNIQCVSENYMPPYATEDLYMAIINCAGNQCIKRCGKASTVISECNEIKDADMCKIRVLAKNAKNHFKDGAIGLLKNDLKIALAIDH